VIYASNAAVDYVKRQPQPARVLALPLAPGDIYRDPYLMLDGLMIHRVRQVLGSHGNELARYQQLVGKDEGYQRALTPALWRLLNVRYLLTNADSTMVPGLRRVVGPAKDAEGSILYLYELPGENPFAWISPAMVKATDEQVLPTVLDARFDPRRVALFDTSAAVQAARQLTSLPAPVADSVWATRYEAGHISLRLASPAPAGSALVVSENFYPGWEATVDGRPTPVARADYTLIGVPLPAGAKSVELSFRSPAYETGKAVTLASLALAVLVAIGGAVVDRRRYG
jgi:hypothetical protein